MMEVKTFFSFEVHGTSVSQFRYVYHITITNLLSNTMSTWVPAVSPEVTANISLLLLFPSLLKQDDLRSVESSVTSCFSHAT
jgi:hypothetical protein